jgi:RHS repeat-associated protein
MLVEKYLYDAYGNMLPGAGLTTDPATALTSILYSGEKTDPTGLQYLRARYYDPAIGRFNRLDPFAGDVQDPLSLHKYLYTHADPIHYADPAGEWGAVATAATIGIASIVSTLSTGALFRVTGGSFFEGLTVGATASGALAYSYYTGRFIPTFLSGLLYGTTSVLIEATADRALSRESSDYELTRLFFKGFSSGATRAAFGSALTGPGIAALNSVIANTGGILAGSGKGFKDVIKDALIQAFIASIISASVKADVAMKVRVPLVEKVLSTTPAREVETFMSHVLGGVFAIAVGAWADIGFDTFFGDK